jgi:hypothetical protein
MYIISVYESWRGICSDGDGLRRSTEPEVIEYFHIPKKCYFGSRNVRHHHECQKSGPRLQVIVLRVGQSLKSMSSDIVFL